MRSLLVWLMVLAVPVQGMAGAAMQHCAQAAVPSDPHERVEAAHHQHVAAHRHEPVLAAADPATAGLWSGSAPGHGPAAAVPAGPAVVDGPDGHDGPDAAGDHAETALAEGGHQCSACAACCSALGLPAWVAPLPMPTVAAVADLLPLVTIDSFVPAGLDRPPRFALA